MLVCTIVHFFDMTSVYFYFTADPVVLSELSHWKSAVQAQYGQVIGETLVYLNGMPTECRLRECNLGEY